MEFVVTLQTLQWMGNEQWWGSLDWSTDWECLTLWMFAYPCPGNSNSNTDGIEWHCKVYFGAMWLALYPMWLDNSCDMRGEGTRVSQCQEKHASMQTHRHTYPQTKVIHRVEIEPDYNHSGHISVSLAVYNDCAVERWSYDIQLSCWGTIMLCKIYFIN